VLGEYVLPVESMAWVNKDGLSLAQNRSALSAYPVFDPAEYPLAPPTWQPPYPYSPGAVRWPLEESTEAERRVFGPDGANSGAPGIGPLAEENLSKIASEV
jgi:hypothetical protein